MLLIMRCNFGLLGNINVIVNFTNVMHERRLAPHDDYHLSSIIMVEVSIASPINSVYFYLPNIVLIYKST